MLDPKTHLRGELEAMLAEGVQGAIEREQSQFDQLTSKCCDSIVLFGARKLGRRTARGLRNAGVEPLAFSDNNPELWGTEIDGIRVYSPADAVQRFGSTAAFVITIWGWGSHDTMAGREQKLSALGAQCVVPFVPLYWKFADYLLPHNALNLPHYAVERAPNILRCFDVLADDESRDQFFRQMKWRLTGDFDALGDPVKDEIYFPSEIASEDGHETFVDCGAYDGDTILRFLERAHGTFHKVFAFEPDPANLSALQTTVSNLPSAMQQKIRILPCALGDINCKVRFSATGTLGASVGSGDVEVDCVRLDEILQSEAPTYIKMDIEASEPDALKGGAEIIRNHQPVIAACSYHVQDHAWTIPLIMNTINPDYAILMRQHVQLVEDLVTYAIPRRRLAGGN